MSAKRISKTTPEHVDLSPTELMKEQGSPSGAWNPIAPGQHAWQLTIDDSLPYHIHRIWAGLLKYTSHFGNRRGFANIHGVPVFAEDLATELGLPLKKFMEYWRLGTKLGLWRGGTKAEGTDRLYLCAVVAPVGESNLPLDEKGSNGSCTRSVPTVFQRVSGYQKEFVANLPEDVRQRATAEYERIQWIRDTVNAEVLATARMVTDPLDDTFWSSLGLQKKRNKGEKDEEGKSPEELAEEKARQARIDAMLPHVRDLVQGLADQIQGSDFPLYNEPELSVQNGISAPVTGQPAHNPPKSPDQQEIAPAAADPATLLVLDFRSPDRSLTRVDASIRAAMPYEGAPFQDGKKSGYLPADESVNPLQKETQAAQSLVAGVAALQRKHPQRFVPESVSWEDKGDRAWSLKIIRTIGTEDLKIFLAYVEQRATKKGLGHRVAPGLIFDWAEAFHRGAAQRRADAARVQAERERQAKLDAEAQQRSERDLALYDLADDTWERMPEQERARRLETEKVDLREDPNWRNLTQDQRRERAVTAAKQKLRREIEAAGDHQSRGASQ